MATRCRTSRLPSVVLVLILATACGGTPAATLVTPSPQGSAAPGSPSTSPAISSPAAGASTPSSGAFTLKIDEPADGASVPAGDLVIEVSETGLTLVNKIGSAPVPGEGHFIYYVGVDFIPTQAGQPAHTAPGTFAASFEASYTWPDLASGTYGIGVQLVNNDDTPLSPPVTARATITVT